jgi:hypothetical protein
MKAKQTLQFFILVPVIVIVFVMGVTVWSELSGVPLSEYFNYVFRPDEIAEADIADVLAKPLSLLSMDNQINPVLSQLDVDSHAHAMQAFCNSHGWNPVTKNGTVTCVAPDEAACTKFSTYPVAPIGATPPLGGEKDTLNSFNTILTWSNGKCIQNKAGNNNICAFQLFDPETKQLKLSYQYEGGSPYLPYVGADVTCDVNGKCTASDYPTCEITEEYCTAKGMAWDSYGLGSCYVTQAEAITEMVLGTTITRTIKKNASDLVNSCNSEGMGSASCWRGVGELIGGNGKVIYDSAIRLYTDNVRQFRSDCLSGGLMQPKTLRECVNAVNQFSPQFWLEGKAALMLNGMVGAIPGFPEMPFTAWVATQAFGGQVLDAVFKFGPTAGVAIYHAGQDGILAIEALFDGNLSDFASYGLDFVKESAEAILNVAEAFSPMVQCGVLAAKAIWGKYGGTAVQIAKCIGNAIVAGSAALGSFVANVLWRNGVAGLSAIANQLGVWFGDAGVLFVNSLEAIGGAFEDVFKSIGNAVEDAAKDVVCLGGIIC